jgi:hypothetical protein
MERLPDLVRPTGTGIPELEARIVMREGDLCLYERSDDVFEVFYPNQQAEGEIYGKFYPAHETYPNNEDFGKTAWCFSEKENAVKRFRRLLEWRGSHSYACGTPVEAEKGVETEKRYNTSTDGGKG